MNTCQIQQTTKTLKCVPVCMKFEVTTMLPVHTTAVKRRLLKLLSSAWL